jgi:NADP-dependent 3-hydroxy acid dehydrogenase YdfG
MSKPLLKNKVVLLTGAGSGIGRCMANEFAQEGCKLILCDLSKTMLEETVSLYKIQDSVLGLLEVNFLEDKSVEKIITQAFALTKTIDILYNNAGYMIMGQFINLTVKDIATLKTVNLDAPIELTRAIIPHMIKNGGGYIGFTCSSSATATPPGATIYGMTKAGLAAFAEALNAELYQHNISVTRICPGYVKTTLLKKAIYRDKLSQERSNSIPDFFGSTPEKVAKISVNSLIKKRAFIIIGKDEKIKYFLKNHLHFVYVHLNRYMAKLLLDAKK